MEQTGKTAGTRATANKNQALNQNNGSKTETHPYKKNITWNQESQGQNELGLSIY